MNFFPGFQNPLFFNPTSRRDPGPAHAGPLIEHVDAAGPDVHQQQPHRHD